MQDGIKRSIAIFGVLRLQGVVYVVTGLWSILHLKSFQKVTGPKVDTWLVQTLGAIVAVQGVSYLVASRRKQARAETAISALGTALSLAAIDMLYVFRRRIRPAYLLDACFELGLVYLWLAAIKPSNPAGDGP